MWVCVCDVFQLSARMCVGTTAVGMLTQRTGKEGLFLGSGQGDQGGREDGGWELFFGFFVQQRFYFFYVLPK